MRQSFVSLLCAVQWLPRLLRAEQVATVHCVLFSLHLGGVVVGGALNQDVVRTNSGKPFGIAQTDLQAGPVHLSSAASRDEGETV